MEGQPCSVQPESKLDLKMQAGASWSEQQSDIAKAHNAVPCRGLPYGGRGFLSLELVVPGRKIGPKNTTWETGKIKGLRYFQLGHFMISSPP